MEFQNGVHSHRLFTAPLFSQIVVAASELELSTKRDRRGRGRGRRKIEGPLFSQSPLPAHTPSRSALAFALSLFVLAVSVSCEQYTIRIDEAVIFFNII